jgi:hypothetical protein
MTTFTDHQALPRKWALTLIKLLHTAIWAFFVACILALPVMGWRHRFDRAALLASLVLVECLVLAANRGRCPLTDVAARYTSDRSPAFDIYLPVGLARWNKTLFGAIFVASGLFVVWEYLR